MDSLPKAADRGRGPPRFPSASLSPKVLMIIWSADGADPVAPVAKCVSPAFSSLAPVTGAWRGSFREGVWVAKELGAAHPLAFAPPQPTAQLTAQQEQSGHTGWHTVLHPCPTSLAIELWSW